MSYVCSIFCIFEYLRHVILIRLQIKLNNIILVIFLFLVVLLFFFFTILTNCCYITFRLKIFFTRLYFALLLLVCFNWPSFKIHLRIIVKLCIIVVNKIMKLLNSTKQNLFHFFFERPKKYLPFIVQVYKLFFYV